MWKEENLLKSFLSSAPQLVHHGNLDFLVSDYLSEITMSLLTAVKHKQPVRAMHFLGISTSIFLISHIFEEYGLHYGLPCKHETTTEASEGEGY